MKTIVELLKQVATLATQYLSAIPAQAPDANGRVWNDSIPLFSGRDGVQSLAAYVATTLQVTDAAAGQLVLAAAALDPSSFVTRYMKRADGTLVTDKQTGEPIHTISLRSGGGNKPFVPGSTVFKPRAARVMPDATVQTGGPVANPATSESF